ncbi:MAG: dephospho-CoA kinase [Gammaproteobacteria bacterium]
MRKIAITGGIASGKSKLTNFLKSKGEVVIDLDEISHTLTDSDEDTINEIAKIFGDDIKRQSGSIDRKLLASKVFSNSESKKQLEEILHPRIRQVMMNEIDIVEKENVFVEVQLLAEKNMESLFDHIIIISASKDQQINRLKTIRMMDSNLINQILDSQLTDEERKSMLRIYPNDILENNGSEDAFQDKIESLYKKLVNQ